MEGFQPQHSRDPDGDLSVGGHVDAALDGQNQDGELILRDGGRREEACLQKLASPTFTMVLRHFKIGKKSTFWG